MQTNHVNYLNYLRLSCERLEEILPGDAQSLFSWYQDHSNCYSFDEYKGYIFCLFSHPYVSFDGEMFEEPNDFCDCPIHRMFVLVYDGNTIIADLSAYTGYTAYFDDPILNEQFFQKQSDWCFLEYGISVTMAKQAYPDNDEPMCITTLFNNAYVTKAYRRQGIFKNMLNMVREMLIPPDVPRIDLITVLSLDPDIACYGMDAKDEPYHYSMKDEKKRMCNQEIMKHLDFDTIRLDDSIFEENLDGTKLWYAIKHEYVHIVETDKDQYA